ncbi:DUF5053 domain-containing protein [Aquiflexum sp.]|uniref:DUF5053 domain-containing protein n=1 Tax=Aquiflexum sp. TaxID=1872584 RepID=UPI003592FB38
MEEKIKDLKMRFRTASKEELGDIDREMEALALENPEAFSKAMLEAVRETVIYAEELRIKEKLDKILPIVSVSYLAKTYFGKTPQWFYQRLNGNIVNGKQARFSEQEIKVISRALNDIGDKLKKSSRLIA